MSIRMSLVCHAGTSSGRDVAFPDDEPANVTVLSKATALGPLLQDASRLWTAPERRARETAAKLGSPSAIIPEVRDCDFGCWRGRRLIDIQGEVPHLLEAWTSNPAAAPHGGESTVDLLKRVGAWLDDYRETGHTVLVTHPMVIRAVVTHSLCAGPDAFRRIDIEPLSVTDLRRFRQCWTLRSLGCRSAEPNNPN
jgi:broad specificity phosphatase PhoE